MPRVRQMQAKGLPSLPPRPEGHRRRSPVRRGLRLRLRHPSTATLENSCFLSKSKDRVSSLLSLTGLAAVHIFMAMDSADDLTRCLVLDTVFAARILLRRYDQVLKPHGVTVQQFALLSAIRFRPAEPVARFAQKVGLDRTSLTRTLICWRKKASSPVPPLRATRGFACWPVLERNCSISFTTDGSRNKVLWPRG